MRCTAFVLPLLAGVGGPAAPPARETLRLAATTSTRDAGLLDVLLPAFEARTGIPVKATAMGSGEALTLARRGGADVLLVHSRAAEDAFLAEGEGLLRLAVMHNDFVLVGPAADPARVRGANPVLAFRRIAEARAPFVSRGDQSGTWQKEQDLWKHAGLEPAGQAWYFATGRGMGETARVAAEKQAYTLIDRATCLATSAKTGLPILCEGAGELRNAYDVIVVNPEKHSGVRGADARRFAEWLVGPEAQKLIGEFGVQEFGRSLFIPDAT